jgi:transcriptional regulator with XRE-family HTH domain
MLDLEEIGSQIRVRRKRLKLTQAELASICDVHLNTITGLERGVAGDIQFKRLLRIMNAVGLDLGRGTLDRPKAPRLSARRIPRSLVQRVKRLQNLVDGDRRLQSFGSPQRRA